MGIFTELTKKPWLADPSADEGLNIQGTSFLPTGKVALRFLLCTISVIFILTIIGYADRMYFPTWKPMPEPWMLWINTALLIASSVAMQWATKSCRRNILTSVRDGLLIGGILSFAFIIGQLYVWEQLAGLGYYASLNMANGFFYLLTALHGLHLLGGLVAWGRSVYKLLRGASVVDIRLSVELCTTYWHYLLIIWLILFGLLLIS
ncbi:MAG: cytochrome c oxidase subunit 3 [Pseudomonadota bacterium]|nr:cytochrome c oxidase subunit 3 [Pseudomonadota bacterium]